MNRTVAWVPVLALACAEDDEARRTAALEAQVAALAARVEVLERRAGAAEPVLARESSGQVVEVLDTKRALHCAMEELQGIVTAQHAFDAAFDRFAVNFEEMRWEPEQSGGCATTVAFSLAPYSPRIGWSDAMPAMPEAIGVILRGPARGRVLGVDRKGTVFELPALPAADLAKVVTGPGWIGATGR